MSIPKCPPLQVNRYQQPFEAFCLSNAQCMHRMQHHGVRRVLCGRQSCYNNTLQTSQHRTNKVGERRTVILSRADNGSHRAAQNVKHSGLDPQSGLSPRSCRNATTDERNEDDALLSACCTPAISTTSFLSSSCSHMKLRQSGCLYTRGTKCAA